MSVTCPNVNEFFDGELAVEAAHAFRDHLAHCHRCQADLNTAMQLAVASEQAIAELTSDEILTAVSDGVVPFILAWEALGQPGPRRDAARGAVVATLVRARN